MKRGSPWPEALELEGLSTDVESLRSLADRFGGGAASSEPLHVLPVRISVRDAAIASPWGALNLTSLDLSEQGELVLRSALGELPLEADAIIGFSPLEVVSSDVRNRGGEGLLQGTHRAALRPPRRPLGPVPGLPSRAPARQCRPPRKLCEGSIPGQEIIGWRDAYRQRIRGHAK